MRALNTGRYLIGDVFDVLPTLPAGSVELVVTSPPFQAQGDDLVANDRIDAALTFARSDLAYRVVAILGLCWACPRPSQKRRSTSWNGRQHRGTYVPGVTSTNMLVSAAVRGAPGRTRTCAHGSGGRCSIR